MQEEAIKAARFSAVAFNQKYLFCLVHYWW